MVVPLLWLAASLSATADVLSFCGCAWLLWKFRSFDSKSKQRLFLRQLKLFGPTSMPRGPVVRFGALAPSPHQLADHVYASLVAL